MVQALRWRSDLPAFWPRPVLPHAQGRSLGDSCRTAVSSRTLSVALGLALLGAVFTAKNARLPILRNSLVYARIVENLELHHLALWQVCSDPSQVHSQGCGFSVLALPFARVAGLNVGLNLASCLATALLIAAMIAFFRRFNGSFDLREEDVPLQLDAGRLSSPASIRSSSRSSGRRTRTRHLRRCFSSASSSSTGSSRTKCSTSQQASSPTRSP